MHKGKFAERARGQKSLITFNVQMIGHVGRANTTRRWVLCSRGFGNGRVLTSLQPSVSRILKWWMENTI